MPWRERIAREKAPHRRLAFQEAPKKGREPWALLRASERREPHLPVEARLVGSDPVRRSGRGTRLPSELVLLPRRTVVAALDDDLRSRGRHHCEKAVAVDRAERLDDEGQERRRARRPPG